MPILHIQFGAEERRSDGSTVRGPSAAALTLRGPVLQATVSIGKTLAEQLTQLGQDLPTPESGFALIDTGASSTCIDDATAQRMGLPAIDVVRIASASHDETERNVYPIQIEVVGLPIALQVPRAVGASLRAHGLLALVGRDALQHCALVYNGIAGSITLCL